MTEHELELRLRAWYRESVEGMAGGGAPPDLRDAVGEIPDRLPPGPELTNRNRFTLLAVAAMLLVLLVGGAIAVASGLVPWFERDRDTLPRSELPPSWREQVRSDLPAGTYYLDVPTGGAGSSAIRVTFTLPSGWERVQIDGLIWGQNKWVHLTVPDNVYVDGCRAHTLHDPPPGPTAAGFAEALLSARGWTVGSAADTVIDGYSGKRVELLGPADSSGCSGDRRLLHVRGGPGYVPAMRDGERGTMWLVDIEGHQLVIWTASEPAAFDTAQPELLAIVGSIQVEYLRPLRAQHGRGAAP